MTGSHKVVGSIPISSTKDFKGLGGRDFSAAFLIARANTYPGLALSMFRLFKSSFS